MKKREPIRAGDLFRVVVDQYSCLLEYVGTHPEYGDVVRVLLGLEVREAHERDYFVLYPLRAAARTGVIDSVGRSSGRPEMPRAWRRPQRRAPAEQAESWVIEMGGEERVVEVLGPEERSLPVVMPWTHDLLVNRIRAYCEDAGT